MVRCNHCASEFLIERKNIVSPVLLLLLLLLLLSTKLRFYLCVFAITSLFFLPQNLLSHKPSVFQNLPVSEDSSETDLLKAAIELNEITGRSI